MSRPESFELDIRRIKRVVFPRCANRRVDHLFVGTFAFSGELGGEVNILKVSPATHIQAEYGLKVVPDFDQVLHHVREGRPNFCCQSRPSMVGKILDDLNTIRAGPFADGILLNRDRVLLTILRRMPAVGRRPLELVAMYYPAECCVLPTNSALRSPDPCLTRRETSDDGP